LASVANIRRTLRKAIESVDDMVPLSDFCSLLLVIDLVLAPLAAAVLGVARGQPGWDAAKGFQCPVDFETIFDPGAKILRCRREVVAWVVTVCPDKNFAAYSVKTGPDGCGPTEIPGVGTPPGASGSRPVACAAAGYAVVADRTGSRDRCERTERSFAFPRPVP
jgi:hypothetical protein